MITPDDSDILNVLASHELGFLRFERARQDRRIYYRMLRDDRGTGSLTSAKGARETIAYWRSRGWVLDCELCGESAGEGGAVCPACVANHGLGKGR